MDDFPSQLNTVHKRRRVLHVTACTILVLDGNHRIATLVREQARVLKQKVWIEPLRQLVAILLGL